MELSSKIYVAGHTGLVGSSLLRALKISGYKNIITHSAQELDLRNQACVDSFFEQECPEYVFLAAAKVGGIVANNTYKAEFIYDNLMIAANVIHASYKYKVKKLLNLGSSCIYPKHAPQPLKEEYLLTGPLESTNEPYAIAKIAAIKLCRYYNEQYGTNFISVMPTNLYGPYDNFNLETAHVLPSIIRKFFLAKLLQEKQYDLIAQDIKNYPLGFGLDSTINVQDSASVCSALETLGITESNVKLWGSGNPKREFLYVDDLASALIFLMEKHTHNVIGEIINIGIGMDISINELALIIKQAIGFSGDICFDNTKPDGTSQKLLDVSRIKLLGWQAKISLFEGINKIMDYYDAYLNKMLTLQRRFVQNG
jgi:GDP-L-fucose synthase